MTTNNACPRCGNTALSIYASPIGNTTVDCGCGWSGMEADLVEAPSTEELVDACGVGSDYLKEASSTLTHEGLERAAAILDWIRSLEGPMPILDIRKTETAIQVLRLGASDWEDVIQLESCETYVDVNFEDYSEAFTTINCTENGSGE